MRRAACRASTPRRPKEARRATWWSRTAGRLSAWPCPWPGPGEAVLVAGKGHENYQIWGAERRHFDDREEVAQALKEYHG